MVDHLVRRSDITLNQLNRHNSHQLFIHSSHITHSSNRHLNLLSHLVGIIICLQFTIKVILRVKIHSSDPAVVRRRRHLNTVVIIL